MMGSAFQMSEAAEDTKCCRTLPNWNKQCIHLDVDCLSSGNFCCLKLNFVKKLAGLSSAEFVLPLLESLSRFTCVHAYFYETRLHCQDVIYHAMYGCFLQAFQFHLGYKRICGDPVKRNVQGHESFLYLVDNVLR